MTTHRVMLSQENSVQVQAHKILFSNQILHTVLRHVKEDDSNVSHFAKQKKKNPTWSYFCLYTISLICLCWVTNNNITNSINSPKLPCKSVNITINQTNIQRKTKYYNIAKWWTQKYFEQVASLKRNTEYPVTRTEKQERHKEHGRYLIFM